MWLRAGQAAACRSPSRMALSVTLVLPIVTGIFLRIIFTSSKTHETGSFQAVFKWCPGPESNRHGVTTEGFSFHLRLSPLRYT